MRHGSGKEGGRRFVDWLEIIFFLVLFCYVYTLTPRAQEFASRSTTPPITSTSRVFDTEKVRMVLDIGTIEIALYPNAAPKTVARFKDSIKSNYYVGCDFYKVYNTLLQGGCEHTKGKEALKPMAHEYHLPNTKRTLSMVKLADEPTTTASEFYINLSDNTEWLQPGGYDVHGYTVFGQVITGWEVVLEAVKKGGNVKIVSTTLYLD
eukprot:TRINITY_DN14622_c0_g1_i1.p1 TRINITY_DN14622_c0_g1~~TRINITY_DN14622_c0_g1_i1.p1  ORF type:complete len:207 (-),score=43.80 TRINITY_DN14622_c0_g1_i1:36-656(-)